MAFKRHEVEDYEKKRYRGWDQRFVHWREKRLLERMLRRISKNPGWALDLPSGYGRFSALLEQHGYTPLDCDLSFHMVERANARRRKDSSSSPLGTVADAVKGLPFKNDSFPLVFSMRLFHHLHEGGDRKSVLDEFHRISKKWLVVSFYQSNALHGLQRKLRRTVKKSQTRIKMIPRDVFRDEAESAGFQVEKISSLFKGLHGQRIALLKKA